MLPVGPIVILCDAQLNALEASWCRLSCAQKSPGYGNTRAAFTKKERSPSYIELANSVEAVYCPLPRYCRLALSRRGVHRGKTGTASRYVGAELPS
jgi:hypothetical protein